MSCLVTFLSQTNLKLRSLNQRFFTIALGLHINFRRKSYLIKKNRRTKIQLLGLPHWHFLTNCLKRYYLPIFKVFEKISQRNCIWKVKKFRSDKLEISLSTCNIIRAILAIWVLSGIK